MEESMVRVSRHSEVGGFTMMEILIAIVVLVIGLVGILALFPIGIDACRRASTNSAGGWIAESVAEAITEALRNVQVNLASPSTINVSFVHAGVPSVTGTEKYDFTLPEDYNVPVLHPQGGTLPVFQLSYKDLDGLTEDNLRRDPYDQFSYQFYVIRRTTNLYEFWVHVYRNFPLNDPSNEDRVARSRVRVYSFLVGVPYLGGNLEGWADIYDDIYD